MDAKYIDPPIDILGLCAVAGGGKDFFATRAHEMAGFVPLALANQFKAEIVAKEGGPVEQIFGDEDYDPGMRQYLQLRGTEQGRDKHGKDIWCRHLEAHIRYLIEHGVQRFVVSDVRFPNEAEWVRALGGKVYRLDGRERDMDGELTEHRSEKLVEKVNVDRTIDNSPGNEEQAVQQFRWYIAEDFNPHGGN